MKFNLDNLENTYFLEAPNGACGNFLQALVHKLLYGNKCFDNTIGAYGQMHHTTGKCEHIEYWFDHLMKGFLEPTNCTFNIVLAHFFYDIDAFHDRKLIRVMIEKNDFIQMTLFDMIKLYGRFLQDEQVILNKQTKKLPKEEQDIFNLRKAGIVSKIETVINRKCPNDITLPIFTDYFKLYEKNFLDKEWEEYEGNLPPKRSNACEIKFRDIFANPNKVMSQIKELIPTDFTDDAWQLYQNYLDKNFELVNNNFNWLNPVTGERQWT